MHELSLVENMLQIIEDAAAEQGFAQVKTIWMEVGQLSCVEKNALRFCFSVVVDGTIVQHAKLEIIDVAGSAWCEHCHCEVAISARYDTCPECGAYTTKVIRGEEIRIKELEVE
ncbi:hydrogenase maturation nickel metallochaperone HypA [Nitrosomonas aestuarii]|uniref:hydrogenase maturation nickel metallochaperone HypA n=1 Tax=Nitrosomonas aestuarii TaxID=52441 RepID=UPI000D324F6E|nr:hydrogenase maturation nickel metallochaperone HypA [Nitrosomonas aestuarii]PTN11163.1 hydrogenase nickel incorporation protein HypA/HybF [Nitrosomonas aestuarii]